MGVPALSAALRRAAAGLTAQARSAMPITGLKMAAPAAALALALPAGAAAADYVVVYDDAVSTRAGRAAVRAAGGTILSERREVGVATARSPDGAFARRAREQRALVGAVSATAPVGRVTTAGTRPALDAFATLGGLSGAGAPPRRGGADPLSALQWNMRMIGATAAGSYRRERGSDAVRVGVIDTGIDARHPDIAPNFNAGLSRNFTRDIPEADGPCEDEPDRSCDDPATEDGAGHGTHVAAIIGAALNGIGIGGVAPDVSLVSLRAGQDSGYFFLDATVAALMYAADNGIDVVNLSFFTDPWLFNCPGNPADTPEEQAEQQTIVAATQRAVDYARAHGVTLISAEGNEAMDLGRPTVDPLSPDFPSGAARERRVDNSCLQMPVESPGVISVSAVARSGRKAFYSNYGTEQTDVSAPGGDILDYFGSRRFGRARNLVLSAYPRSLARAHGDIDSAGRPRSPEVVRDCRRGRRCGYYVWEQGTSVAAPHASGVAALIVAAHGLPDPVHGGVALDPAVVERILRRSAVNTPCPPRRTLVYPGTDPPVRATCRGGRRLNGFYGDGIVSARRAAGGA